MASFVKSAFVLVLMTVLALMNVDGAVISKRQIGFTGLAGGFSSISVDDAKVKEMADFATSAVSAASNSGPASLVQIVKAETQVVAGTNYKLNLLLKMGATSEPCEVVIFDQPWTNTRKLIKSSCTPSKRLTRQSPVQDTALVGQTNFPIAGGFSPVSVDDAEVKEMAAFATNAISTKSNSGPASLVQVVKAESQVVAGANYKLTLLMNIGANSTPQQCEVVVFDQSWTQTRQLIKSTC